MPGIPFNALVDQFVNNLERLSATVIRARSRDRDRPARLRVVTSRHTDCILFLWAITAGGGGAGVRPAGERRIQITGVNRMPLEPGVRTLLGGWSEEYSVYAFWDARRHVTFGSSPSLQVNDATLEAASTIGIATQLRPTREGEEVVAAVSPNSLLWYLENGAPLHNAGNDATAVVDLADASQEEERDFLDSAKSEAESARRYDLVETMRAFRDAAFKPAVLQAYSYKCAVCECDLKLVDAAHIVPVSHPTSRDEVTNGIALCRLHHGAFDNALLGVQSDYQLIINPERSDKLREIGMDTWLPSFQSTLPPRIRVPASIEARPSAENLKLGLRLRRWPDALIA